MRIRGFFKRQPPIWETPEWDDMSWDEKMALWERHKKINFVLGCIFVCSFLGSLAWYVRGEVKGTAGAYDLIIAIGVVSVMGLCLYLARNLMD